jgi:hypothetical protein
MLRREIDDVIHLGDVSFVHLGYHVVKFGQLVADLSEVELCLRLSEP